MSNLLLGQSTPAPLHYSPDILFSIERKKNRTSFGIDIWNAYEISWINSNNSPQVGIIQLRIPSDSPNIIESKSLKLYFNSLNMTVIHSEFELCNMIEKDLSSRLGKSCVVTLFLPKDWEALSTQTITGQCIDQNIEDQEPSNAAVTETLFSHL